MVYIAPLLSLNHHGSDPGEKTSSSAIRSMEIRTCVSSKPEIQSIRLFLKQPSDEEAVGCHRAVAVSKSALTLVRDRKFRLFSRVALGGVLSFEFRK